MATETTKKFCWVCWWGGRCLRIALAGSFRSAQNWAGVLGAAIIAFILHQYGHRMMPAQSWQEIAVQGLLYIVASWMIIFLVRLLVAPFQVHRDGEWHGGKFVYREPKFAFHRYVSPKDNNIAFKFRFLDAPPYSLISYKFVLDGSRDLISAIVMAHPNELGAFKNHEQLRYSKGSLLVNRKREMWLNTFMRESADPFSVRIYVTGWEDGRKKPAPPAPISERARPAYFG